MNTTKTDWRELALDLANVAAELATVARSAALDSWHVAPLVRGMLNNNAAGVMEAVERVREAAE
jgi:hypothetical protein